MRRNESLYGTAMEIFNQSNAINANKETCIHVVKKHRIPLWLAKEFKFNDLFLK